MIQQIIALLFKRKKISTFDGLMTFIVKNSAKMSGELVIKYSQKRLGKLHYKLSKDDINYVKELVACQSKLHAWVMVDYYCLLMKLTELVDTDAIAKLIDSLMKVHQYYLNSAPAELIYDNTLGVQDFKQKKMALREMANVTGEKLFKLLPMTDQMKKSDVIIFQGQIRLSYINFLTDLDKQIKPSELKNITLSDSKH